MKIVIHCLSCTRSSSKTKQKKEHDKELMEDKGPKNSNYGVQRKIFLPDFLGSAYAGKH